MANEIDSGEEIKCKKRKLTNETAAGTDPEAEDLSAHSRLNSFGGFKLRQVLSDNNGTKSIFLEGTFDNGDDDSAVVLLEKLHFTKESVDKLLNSSDINLRLKSENGASKLYDCHPMVDRGDIKATLIYPATPLHLEKYLFQSMFVIEETQSMYENFVLPHLQSQKFSIQWVYNILEHKSEMERIVFEDPDPETGFILLPDMKWDESQVDNIYVIAICQAKNVKSIRDLNAEHLSLLKNIKAKGLNAITKKYKVPAAKLRVYLHYQPSYYHLHVHFNCVQNSMPGTQFEKAHLLDTVISNIELCPSYYQKATLTYTLKQNDPLFLKLKIANVLST